MRLASGWTPQADVLISRVHGRRPVTLIGYSMGARVIYYCLQEMAARHEHGIVENGNVRRPWRPSRTAEPPT